MKQRERADEKEKDYEKDAKGYFAVGSKTLKYVAFNRVSEVINRGRFHVKCLSVCEKNTGILHHDNDYQVVKSNKALGVFQHDLLTWEFEGNRLLVTKSILLKGGLYRYLDFTQNLGQS